MSEILFVRQEWWETIIAGYLFLGGLAGAIVPVAYYYWIKEKNKMLSLVGGISAFIGIVVGIFLLILDLGIPSHAIEMFISPRLNLGSWMTIGTYIIVLFTIFTGLYTIPFLPWFKIIGGKFTRKQITILGGIASILGLATAAYTGFLLGAAKGIQFWNTPILPILFVASATSSALCFYCAVAAPILLKLYPQFKDIAARVRLQLQRFDLYVMLGELFIIFVYLNIALWGLPGTRESALLLISGSLAPLFWIGVVLIGLVIPIIILWGYTLRIKDERQEVIIASAIAGWMVLIGAFILRYVILTAGVIAVPQI
ncbi:MAG: polysulfide reductase NrfD [Desulfurococcales archaeon]|nr:polysulfide reductase NrfD [Desulfurococcales archaeon]